MNSIEFTFTAPNRAISTNESNRLHWAQRKRELDPWKDLSWYVFKKATKEQKEFFTGEKFKCQITIPFNRNARRDPHNYVGTICKGIVDSLTEANLIPDDTTEFVEVLEPILTVDKNYVVIVKLWRNNE